MTTTTPMTSFRPWLSLHGRARREGQANEAEWGMRCRRREHVVGWCNRQAASRERKRNSTQEMFEWVGKGPVTKRIIFLAKSFSKMQFLGVFHILVNSQDVQKINNV
jgi:hypothetical protein